MRTPYRYDGPRVRRPYAVARNLTHFRSTGRWWYWLRPEPYRVAYRKAQTNRLMDAIEPHMPAIWASHSPLWERWAKEAE